VDPIRQKITRILYSTTRSSMLKCLDELDQLQWLSEEQQIALQRRRLGQVLEYANTYVPYYRDIFKKIGFHPADFTANPTCFQELPLLTKDAIRQNYDHLITTEPTRQNSLVKAKTGGTTGEPMWFMQDQTYDDYRIAINFHQMQWSGWQLGQPEGRLWGHTVVGSGGNKSFRVKLKEKVVNRYGSNAFHMTPESMEAFSQWLEKHPQAVVWSYVSTMYRFAQFVQERGRPIGVQAVYTAAEPLYDYHREFIEATFSCKVFNSYSSIETGDIACECDRHDGLHIMMRNCYLEVLQNGRPVSDGEEGEFIITNLTNLSFPLIRYKIEDAGIRRATLCSCGRGLPMLKIVEGRTIDFFKTRAKGKIWAAFAIPMVPALGKIKQYQIVQKSLDLIVFRIVKDGPINEGKFKEIQSVCKTVLGENVEAKLEYVDSLPSTATGKHRYTISEVE